MTDRRRHYLALESKNDNHQHHLAKLTRHHKPKAHYTHVMKHLLNLTLALTFLLTLPSYGQHPTEDGKGLRYEAEEAEFSGGAFVQGQLLHGMSLDEASCLFTVDGGKGGMFDLVICYATEIPEPHMEFIVNGESETLKFQRTESWNETSTLEMTVKLKPGDENKIEFKSKGHGVNLDYIELKPSK